MSVKKESVDVGIAAKDLFKGIKYYLIGNIDEKIEKILNDHGGKKDSYLSQMVTHVIADDDKNEEFSEAKELFELPVITSKWVELSHYCGKLLPLNAFNPETSQIFSGVVACSSQLPSDDSAKVWAMITFHAGNCQVELNKNCTHLVVPKPQGAKYDCAMKHEDVIKIVTPDWITDCMKEKKRVDESRYHPKLLILEPPGPPTPPPADNTAADIPQRTPQRQQVPVPGVQPLNQFRGRLPPPIQHQVMPRQTSHSDVQSRQPFQGQMLQQNRHSFRPQQVSGSSSMPLPERMQYSTPSYPGQRMECPGQYPRAQMMDPSRQTQLMDQSRHLTPNQMMGQNRMSSPSFGMAHPPVRLSSNMSNVPGPPNHPLPQMDMSAHSNVQRTDTGAREALARMVNSRLQTGRAADTSENVVVPMMNMNQRPQNPLPLGQVSQHTTPPTSGNVSPRAAPPLSGSPLRSSTPTQPKSPRGSHSRANTPNRMLRNITNNGEDNLPADKHNKIQQIMSSITRSPRTTLTSRPNQFQNCMQDEARYYGHDENDKVPGNLCLIGCIFYITDYQKYMDKEELGNWQMVIEQHGGIVDPSYSNRVTHILCEQQKSDVFQMALRDNKRVVTAHWLNDVLTQKKMCPPWHAIHLPLMFTGVKPGKDQIIAVSGYTMDQRLKVKQMVSLIGAKYTGYMSRANTVLVCQKLEGIKYEKAKEWRIPVVNVQWLSEIFCGNLSALKSPVALKYQQFGIVEDEFRVELTQVQHLLNGWRVPVKVPKESWKKFTPSSSSKSNSQDQETNKRKASAEENMCTAPESKKQRIVPESELDTILASSISAPKILFTGLPKSLLEDYVKGIEKLGGSIASTSADCTHLISKTVSRTVKFLTCVSTCRFVVIPEWLDDSIKKGTFLDEDRYIVNDKSGEEQLGCNIKQALSRASKRKLFQGFTFYITPSVQPPLSVMKEVIENAGGKTVKRKPAVKTVANGKNEKGEQTYIIIAIDSDLHLCKDYFSRKIDVYNAEFVLSGVLRQEIDYYCYKMTPS